MLIKSFVKIILVLIYTVAITSCASPYFGYTESEWHKLDSLQQNTVNAEYGDIIASRHTLKRQDEIDKFMTHRLSEYERGVFFTETTPLE